VEKNSPKFFATSVIFKNLPKENNRPNKRKFAQSGHPAYFDLWYENKPSGNPDSLSTGLHVIAELAQKLPSLDLNIRRQALKK
jgi:hypothetical protein